MDIVKHRGLQWTFRANAAHNENKIIKSQYPEATEKEMGKDMIKGNITTEGTAIGTFYSIDFVRLSEKTGIRYF